MKAESLKNKSKQAIVADSHYSEKVRKTMMWEISLDNFKQKPDLVENYILDSQAKAITTVEYRTFDEGMCDATFFILPKNNVQSVFEAFVTLCNCYLHFYQEWALSETKPEHIDDIVNRWLLPEMEQYSFTKMSETEIKKQTEPIIEDIVNLIAPNIDSPEKHKYPDRWGIYVNDSLVSCEGFELPTSNNTLTGVGLDLEWNAVEMFYETTDEYVFFGWGTGR